MKLPLSLIYLLFATVSLTAQETYRDNFSSVSYSNNNGSQNWATNWIETDEISLESAKDLDENKLQILVEKDFVCLTRKDDPDNLDAFPNPDIDC